MFFDVQFVLVLICTYEHCTHTQLLYINVKVVLLSDEKMYTLTHALHKSAHIYIHAYAYIYFIIGVHTCSASFLFSACCPYKYTYVSVFQKEKRPLNFMPLEYEDDEHNNNNPIQIYRCLFFAPSSVLFYNINNRQLLVD